MVKPRYQQLEVLMQHQTGLTVISPANKPKNCRSWAEYEEPRQSRPNEPNTANLCNGGWFKGDFYEPCASRPECAQETRTKMVGGMTGRPFGTQTHQERPFGSQLLATTPNLTGWNPLPTTMPKSYLAQPQQQGATRPNVAPNAIPSPLQIAHPLPYPVQPPAEWPAAMHTPYVGPSPVLSGGITPTFLPAQHEDPFMRLLRNIGNGMVGAAGWQIFDMARSVDMFGRRR